MALATFLQLDAALLHCSDKLNMTVATVLDDISAAATKMRERPLLDQLFLFTDADVLFLGDIAADIEAGSLSVPSPAAFSTEIDFGDFNRFNSGVMLGNAPALLEHYSSMIEFFKEDRFECTLHAWAQGCLRRYFIAHSFMDRPENRLPQTHNWKPYYTANHTGGIRLLHFHGPKPLHLAKAAMGEDLGGLHQTLWERNKPAGLNSLALWLKYEHPAFPLQGAARLHSLGGLTSTVVNESASAAGASGAAAVEIADDAFSEAAPSVLPVSSINSSCGATPVKCDVRAALAQAPGGYLQWVRCNHTGKLCPSIPRETCDFSALWANVHALAHRCLANKSIVFAGDSLSRYSYLNLANFLRTGQHVTPRPRPPYSSAQMRQEKNNSTASTVPSLAQSQRWNALPQLENEREWGTWARFYAGTNALLGGWELCDCFRPDPSTRGRAGRRSLLSSKSRSKRRSLSLLSSESTGTRQRNSLLGSRQYSGIQRSTGTRQHAQRLLAIKQRMQRQRRLREHHQQRRRLRRGPSLGCARLLHPSSPPRPREVRYFYDPRSNIRLTYAPWLGNTVSGGASMDVINASCHQQRFEARKRGDASGPALPPCSAPCVAGSCTLPAAWSAQGAAVLPLIAQQLRPDVMVINSGHWSTFISPDGKANLTAAIREVQRLRPRIRLIWRDTTPINRVLDRNAVDAWQPHLMQQREGLLALLADLGVERFPAYPLLRQLSVPPVAGSAEVDPYWDRLHFHSWAYGVLNALLLPSLCA